MQFASLRKSFFSEYMNFSLNVANFFLFCCKIVRELEDVEIALLAVVSWKREDGNR